MTIYMEENLDMPLGNLLSIIQDRLMNQTTYFGVKAMKSPIDYWVYQEIIRGSFLITWNPKGYRRRTRLRNEDLYIKDYEWLRTKKEYLKSMREIIELILPPILLRMIGKLRS